MPSDNRVIRPKDTTDVFIVLDVDLMLLFLGMGMGDNPPKSRNAKDVITEEH